MLLVHPWNEKRTFFYLDLKENFAIKSVKNLKTMEITFFTDLDKEIISILKTASGRLHPLPVIRLAGGWV